MASIIQPLGAQSYPGELISLQNSRYRCTVLLPLQSTENVPSPKMLALGSAYSDIYAIDTNESAYSNLRLISQRVVGQDGKVSIQQVYETLTDSFVAEVDDVIDYELNGLKRITRSLIAKAGTSYSAYVVGTQSYSSGPTTYLAQLKVEDNDAYTRISAVYLEPGIVQAETQQGEDGLLLVTFRSFYTKYTPTTLNSPTYSLTDLPNLAFQGGAAASLLRSKVENVLGYKLYTVTSMMKSDGSALSTSADNTIQSYQSWIQYEKPGLLDVSDNTTGPVATPGNARWVKALVEDILTTVSTDSGNAYLPFSVKSWANYRVSYTPADGSSPVVVVKAASGYLANSSASGSNTTLAGVAVNTYTMSASSDPTPSAYYALNNQTISSDAGPAFVTDAGVKWYRRRKVSVVGTLGTYLNI